MWLDLRRRTASGSRYRLVTEPMMFQWSWKLILVLVWEAKRALKPSAPQTTLSVNSTTCTGSCSCMEDGATDVSAGSSATISTKTSYWFSLRSSFRLAMASLVRFSLLTGCRHSTTLYGHHGLASSPTPSNKMLMTNTATSTRKCTRPARRAFTSTSRSFGNGSFSRYGTELLAISALSM